MRRLSKKKPFKAYLRAEDGSVRLYVLNPAFYGRIRKRLGPGNTEDYEGILARVRYEIENSFPAKENITLEAVDTAVTNIIDMHLKKSASIFDYSEQFIEMKRNSFNKFTRRNLTRNSINSYKKALEFFKQFIYDKHLSTHPSMMNERTLNDFYLYLKGGANYRVKMHRRIKEFLKYLYNLDLPVHSSYKKSIFTEEYDNQDFGENDRALTVEEVQKLLNLRNKFKAGLVEFPAYKTYPKLCKQMQDWQRKTKIENTKRSLDCFLFMVATGQYHSDIKKSMLTIRNEDKVTHMSYRRAKNRSLCKGIPVLNNDVFITKDLIQEYGIRSDSNFPLNLSVTAFERHLRTISQLAGLDFVINPKMARKTFASYLYFTRKTKISNVAVLLGHKDVRTTQHYLRIQDSDLAAEIAKDLL
jgi:site-specific recombinase XerD